jgi:hypothetical protein
MHWVFASYMSGCLQCVWNPKEDKKKLESLGGLHVKTERQLDTLVLLFMLMYDDVLA